MSPGNSRKRRGGNLLMEIAAVSIWFGLVVAGLAKLAAYSNTPGDARLPGSAAIAATLRTNLHLPLLVMSLHPHCGCSHASLAEFERVLAKNPGRCQALILFAKPRDAAGDWARTTLFTRASEVGCAVKIDEDAAISSSLGALTSGHVMLFGEQDRLLFSGGITASRAHEGDNPSKDALMAALRGEKPAPSASPLPVFGCALAGEAAPPGANERF